MLLTSVSMRWILGRFIPTVSCEYRRPVFFDYLPSLPHRLYLDLTSLDKYSLSSTVIITMLLLYHATIAAMLQFIPAPMAYRIDKAVFIFFFGLILLKQCLFAFWVTRATHYRENVRKVCLPASEPASQTTGNPIRSPFKNKKLHIIDDDASLDHAQLGPRDRHRTIFKRKSYGYDPTNISEV
jgi:hypothetical protein